MEQLQVLLPAPIKVDVNQVNQRLRDLHKRAFEVRQMQLMMMKDIDVKYKSGELIPKN